MDSPVNSTVEAELFVLSAEENNVYLTGCYHQTMEAQSHYGPVDWVMEQWKVSKIYYTPDFSSLLSPIIKSKRWRTYAYVVIKAKSGYSGPKTYRRAYSVNAGNQHQKPRIEMEYFDKTPGKHGIDSIIYCCIKIYNITLSKIWEWLWRHF